MRRISWLAENLLAYQEGLLPMELGSQFEGFGMKLFSLFRVVHVYYY
jgi:hypothetical protein